MRWCDPAFFCAGSGGQKLLAHDNDVLVPQTEASGIVHHEFFSALLLGFLLFESDKSMGFVEESPFGVGAPLAKSGIFCCVQISSSQLSKHTIYWRGVLLLDPKRFHLAVSQ